MNRRSLVLILTAGAMMPSSVVAQSLLDKARGALDSLSGRSAGGAPSVGGFGSELSVERITDGLKEALRIATDKTVDTVGRADGYWGDPKIRIPLPASLQKVDQALKLIGYGDLTEDVQLRVNRAAEAAAPEAREVFVESIVQMSVEDARKILDGPDNAATEYFRKTMSDPLKARMRPIIDRQLSEVGAIKSLDTALTQARSIPGLPAVSTGLSDYTLDGALAGLFHYVAEEEKAIRQNPAARTTDLLKKVFG